MSGCSADVLECEHCYQATMRTQSPYAMPIVSMTTLKYSSATVNSIISYGVNGSVLFYSWHLYCANAT